MLLPHCTSFPSSITFLLIMRTCFHFEHLLFTLLTPPCLLAWLSCIRLYSGSFALSVLLYPVLPCQCWLGWIPTVLAWVHPVPLRRHRICNKRTHSMSMFVSELMPMPLLKTDVEVFSVPMLMRKFCRVPVPMTKPGTDGMVPSGAYFSTHAWAYALAQARDQQGSIQWHA